MIFYGRLHLAMPLKTNQVITIITSIILIKSSCSLRIRYFLRLLIFDFLHYYMKYFKIIKPFYDVCIETNCNIFLYFSNMITFNECIKL